MSFAELVKHKVFRFFITHFLMLLGATCPDFVDKMIDEMRLPKRQAEIIRLRYIEGMKFEAIPEMVNCELRNVFILHKDYIDKLTSFVMSYKRNT